MTIILIFVETQKAMRTQSSFRHYLKLAALFMVVAGIPLLIMRKDPGSDLVLLIGLFMLLVVTEKVEDERSLMLKTTSLYTSFIVSYAVKLLTTNLYTHGIIGFELVEINHFMILVLAVANLIFYSRMYVVRS